MNLKPQDNRVVLKLDLTPTKTAGGLELPETLQDKDQKGTVLAIGPGKLSELGERLPLEVAVGDRVVTKKNVGTKVAIGGEEVHLVFENDILAVIE